ncbi:hypothetical protein Hanom_Chr06g00538471 [Helianthus anomalus]
MVPPKGMTKRKTKFFYVKADAITPKLQFRNATGTIIMENISIPKTDTVEWFPQLRIIGWFKLYNRNARPMLWEKNGEEAPLWRMFCSDFKGKVEILTCGAGEEGWNRTIIENFRMPDTAALNVVLQEGKCMHEAVSVPSLVPEVASIPRTRLRKNEDYVVVSDTLEGLGVPGGSAAVGGSTAGTKPFDVKKRKEDTPVAGGEKAPKLRKKLAVEVEIQKKDFKETAGETIVDTLDSSNNLINPLEDGENRGEKPNSLEKTFGSTAVGKGGEGQPSIQPWESELEFYYRSYAADRGLDYHHPPWNVMQRDDVSNDPSTCREILGGLGTPFETARARGLSRQNRINQLSSMLVGSSITVNAIMEYYNVLARREEENIRLQAEAEVMVKAAREGTK